MLRHANPTDLADLKAKFEREVHENVDSIAIGSFLTHDNTFVFQNESSKMGHAVIMPKVLELHGKRLKASYIIDIEDEDETILEELVAASSHEELVTLLQSSDARKYEAIGFEPVVEIMEYNIQASSLPELGVEGIVLDPVNQDLVSVYNRFTKHFTGYFIRDASSFEAMKKELDSIRGGIIGFSENGILVGYAIYENKGSFMKIRECIYEKSGHLLRMLSFLSRGKSRIILQTSVSEHINRLIPDAKRVKKHFLLARINDKQLFERLFHIKIISSYSGFNAFGKPLWNRDFY
ncbi:hypothetical protein [Erysipelothrix anatis]|uniref:hypothetical protein n=1 Tax=Erysipelothrix anatis TaxID=2683713 RepID=UPI001407B35B|nr:hypothetical protein [Erysipelothrix anatis]